MRLGARCRRGSSPRKVLCSSNASSGRVNCNSHPGGAVTHMIRIGNQTSCWAPSPAEPFNYAVANGFDAFEWFPDKKPGVGWDDSDLDPAKRRDIRETAKEKGIRLS